MHSAHTQDPGRAHTARTVPMSWALLRAQQACRARSQRRSSAQRAQVTRIAPRSWAHVATSFPCPVPSQVVTSSPGRNLLEANPCRDIKLVSRHCSVHSRSRPPNGVATPFLLLSPQAMSRHQIGVATPPRPIQVATPKLGRDLPRGYPMLRHQIHVATPFLPTVGFPGRDTKNSGRNLPHCHPCRDILSMSRRRFYPTKADQVATSLPGRDLTPNLNQTKSRP